RLRDRLADRLGQIEVADAVLDLLALGVALLARIGDLGLVGAFVFLELVELGLQVVELLGKLRKRLGLLLDDFLRALAQLLEVDFGFGHVGSPYGPAASCKTNLIAAPANAIPRTRRVRGVAPRGRRWRSGS